MSITTHMSAHCRQELCNPAHRHVLDAILDVNIKVFQGTRDSKIPQQPRLDVSAPPGLFDTFNLVRHNRSFIQPREPCNINIIVATNRVLHAFQVQACLVSQSV